MKKLLYLVLLCCVMQGVAYSQITMPVSNGSFEQWTSHSGYNVSIMGMNLPVYEAYFTPTEWDYLAYPVNEAFSVYGSTINVNTTLPLIKISQETGTVPDGSKAVKLETFMLSDIVSGLVYVMAASELDPILTSTVFPSILSTGVVNVDSLMPLVTTVLANTDSLMSILRPMASMDVNNFITGGIDLGGNTPSQLNGYYKYQSGESTDNGGVIMLGTRYNTTTQRREVVGGGINIALTDISSFTPFTVEYQSLHELDPSFAEQAPDSLIVLLVSSANNERAHGSYLCVDNLNLMFDTTSVVEEDTCASVLNLMAINTAYDAFPLIELQWTGSSQPDHWQIEYGPQGFTLGNGTTVSSNTTSFAFYELEEQGILQPNTWYDFYVRSVCDDDTYGEWDSIHYRTFCAKVSNLAMADDNITVNADGLLEGYRITWSDATDTWQWMVSYGIAGTDTGNNEVVDEPQFNMPPLRPETRYEVWVYSLCDEDNYGEPQYLSFTTSTVGIANVEAVQMEVYPNPANGRCVVTLPDNTEAELNLYSADGRLIKTIANASGATELQLPSQGVFLLQATTQAGTATRKIINR